MSPSSNDRSTGEMAFTSILITLRAFLKSISYESFEPQHFPVSYISPNSTNELILVMVMGCDSFEEWNDLLIFRLASASNG
jgi:hypothetical protein